MSSLETSTVLRAYLSGNLKKHRKKLNLSQEKLAEKTGLSAQTINDIEGLRTWVSDKTLQKLADSLMIDAFQLLLPNTSESKNGQKKPEKPPAVNPLFSLQKNLTKEVVQVIEKQFIDYL